MSALAARLGDTLLARGWLDADQLDIAQAEVRAGRPLEQALAQLGFVPDGVLRDTLAELLGLDSLEARALVADSTALAVVPAHWARQLRVLPLRYAPANQTLTIASARPMRQGGSRPIRPDGPRRARLPGGRCPRTTPRRRGSSARRTDPARPRARSGSAARACWRRPVRA